ncbi:MAG TPA: glycosyltransferase [Acidimicrobiales bacterium]|jgi:hypothetical protein|nr:glycosyltransferase [Acidimicrobiales bacterium]
MAAHEQCDGVVCFAAVDWWYHSQGHSERQLMRRLVDSMPVVWVNPIALRAPRPGRTEMPFRRIARKLGSTLKGFRRDESGIRVLSPLFIPVYNDRFARVNGWLLRVQARLAARAVGIRHPAAFVTLPTAAHAVDRGRWHRVVYNRSDNFRALPEVDQRFVGGLEDHLLTRADEVLYVNHELLASEQAQVRRATYLGHGVDAAHFAAGASQPEPTEVRDLPRPILGFYGALDEFTIDLDLLVALADRFPSATLLLIGTQAMELDRLLERPNVTYRGPIPYDVLPAYAARFDVGLMPWLRNEWIRFCNPIKLKEYLAAGFPVVSVDFPELAPYRDLVAAADSHEAFLDAVAQALGDQDPARRAARQARVADSSWAGLAERVRVSLAGDAG